MFVCLDVFYAFLNRPSAYDDIWYRDILDLGEEDFVKTCKQDVQTVEVLKRGF